MMRVMMITNVQRWERHGFSRRGTDDDGGGAYVTVTVIASWNRERVQQQQHDVLLTSFNTCWCKEFCSFIVSVNRCDSCMTEPLSNNWISLDNSFAPWSIILSIRDRIYKIWDLWRASLEVQSLNNWGQCRADDREFRFEFGTVVDCKQRFIAFCRRVS